MSKPSRESSEATNTSVIAAPRPSAPVQVHFDPTPPLAHDVLALFRGAFAEVRFPDVDRASLEEDHDALLACQAEVEALEAELDRARQVTREAAAVLNTSAGRALAYASIFASGHPALEEALRAVRAGQADASSDQASKKRRGRPPRHAAEQLPIEASARGAQDPLLGGDFSGSASHPASAESEEQEGHESSHDQAAE